MAPNPVVSCPACESDELRPGPFLARCTVCDYALSRDLFLTLRRIRALPEAKSARWCGNRTRNAPDCPACTEEGVRREAPRKA